MNLGIYKSRIRRNERAAKKEEEFTSPRQTTPRAPQPANTPHASGLARDVRRKFVFRPGLLSEEFKRKVNAFLREIKQEQSWLL